MVIYVLVLLYMILYGVYIMGITGYILGGVLFLCICFIVLVMYIYVVFISFPSFYILYAYFFVHITLVFLSAKLCDFIYNWMKTLRRCMHMCSTICSYMCVLKYICII